MFFLLKAAFWLSLVFFVVRYDAGDGQDRTVAIAPIAALGEAKVTLGSVTARGKALASNAAQACEIVGSQCPEGAKSAIALAGQAAQMLPSVSQHTLVAGDIAAAPWGGEAAPRMAAQKPAQGPALTAPLPLPRRPA